MMDGLDERFSPERDLLVASNFDGSLAPIVDDPSDAAPLPDSLEALDRLARTAAEVAVLSGRPLSYLEPWFGPGVTLSALYGLELRRDGERLYHDNAGVWRETMTDVATGARLRGPEGMRVELKELSITLHYREHPEVADDVLGYARSVSGPSGLRIRPARMGVELHPPIDVDKGSALSRLAGDHSGAVVFVGDDVGDLPAFDALDEIGAAGRAVMRVAVRSDEVPAELIARADLVLDGPERAVDLLDALADLSADGSATA